MENSNNENYTSEMRLGFAFMQTQNAHPFQNFLKKIEMDETNNKLLLTFSKFASKPVEIDFKNQNVKLPSNKVTPFKKFITVTYEFVKDKKAVALKVFRFDNGKLYKGIKYFSSNELDKVQMINFLNLDYEKYMKASKKMEKNDTKYAYPIPDFYKNYISSGK